MGSRLIDQYSLLHFAVGIVAYFWGFSWQFLFVSHTLFELIENTPTGISFINNQLSFWPGGKPKADTWLNIFGDTICVMAGWILSRYADSLSIEKHLYP